MEKCFGLGITVVRKFKFLSSGFTIEWCEVSGPTPDHRGFFTGGSIFTAAVAAAALGMGWGAFTCVPIDYRRVEVRCPLEVDDASIVFSEMTVTNEHPGGLRERKRGVHFSSRSH